MRESKIYNWLKENLFSTWYNFLISITYSSYIFFTQYQILLNGLLLIQHLKVQPNKTAKVHGACWVFVKVWFEKFIYGFYKSN